MPPNVYDNPDILLTWPRERLSRPPEVALPDEYALRTYRGDDADAWVRIHRAAVPSFPESDLRTWLQRYLTLALPRGIFVATVEGSDEPVATAGCIHGTREGTIPFGGQLAWVATAPTHQRRGLARALSALATRRLIEIGYESIFVCTGDDLTPAISVYLELGYEPYLYEPGMDARWYDIMVELGRPFDGPACAQASARWTGQCRP
jgi:mycothiol synthase